jgi:hypothetical protein
MAAAARRGYTARLAAVAVGAGGESEAREYVDRLRLCYEWEGFHDCPEREAAFAEQYLAANPRSALRDYLPFLAAHRWQCAVEGYEYERRTGLAAASGAGVERARRAYHSNLARAVRSDDPLVRFAANALERAGSCLGGR